MGSSIQIDNLCVNRGTFVLHIDRLHVHENEVFAILGQTGSGKTVLLESIAGAFPLQSGSIKLDNQDISHFTIQERSLGIVYQDHMLFEHMTVRENIGYGLRMQGMSKDEIEIKTNALLDLFSITKVADKYPGVISGGESQRTALARALILEPEILLLDEPFASLDPSTKERMYTTIESIQKAFDCTILFVTHDFSEAQRLASRIGIILNGELQTIVNSNELFSAHHSKEVQEFLGMNIQDNVHAFIH